MERHIYNGGLEQALLEVADQDGLLSEKDKERLQHLKSLPQNRHEWEEKGELNHREIAPIPLYLHSSTNPVKE